ncbi:restriction endonuclease subunit S [Thermococcus celericrescens]|uniref:restriction endonuclease subunit S n=1 Tax=Thermococcus celericrescens TaxID=227598 RepID=UPI0009FAE3AA|nr:restriction endonuclease subunit S [Thermococcus celericrescens]
MSEALPAFQFYRETRFKEVELNGRKVRIPEEWEVVELGDVAEKFLGGGTPSTKKPEYWGGKIPWITSAIISGYYITEGEKYITELGLKNSSTNIVPKGHIIVATRVGLGKAAITKIDVAINQDLTGIILKSEKIEPEYAVRVITSPLVARLIIASARGTTIKGISRKELSKIKLPLPPLSEQKKIAEVLRTIDEAIQAVDESIAKLERLKKGSMERLLTQGINHTRFKEVELNGRKVRIPEEWEVKKVEDVIIEAKPGFASGKRDENGIIQLRMNNITTDGRVVLDHYLKVPIPRNKNIEDYLLKPGDVLFNNTNSVDLLGKSAVFRGECDFCTYSNHITRIRVKEDITIPEWLVYNFIRLWQMKYFKQIAIRHVGQAGIRKADLLAVKLPLPPLEEQKKIAEILRTIDEAIEAKRAKKEKLERMKKAVMEKLLTGEIRVR